jgi:hypothetical protein
MSSNTHETCFEQAETKGPRLILVSFWILLLMALVSLAILLEGIMRP